MKKTEKRGNRKEKEGVCEGNRKEKGGKEFVKGAGKGDEGERDSRGKHGGRV